VIRCHFAPLAALFAGLDIGALLVKEGLAEITDPARGDDQEIEARARAARQTGTGSQ